MELVNKCHSETEALTVAQPASYLLVYPCLHHFIHMRTHTHTHLSAHKNSPLDLGLSITTVVLITDCDNLHTPSVTSN